MTTTIFNVLSSAAEEARTRLAAHGLKQVTVQFYFSTAWGAEPTIQFTIKSGPYNNETEVKGKDFSQMVDELLRRHGFDAQQQQVLLAPPEPEAPPAQEPIMEYPLEEVPVEGASKADDLPF